MVDVIIVGNLGTNTACQEMVTMSRTLFSDQSIIIVDSCPFGQTTNSGWDSMDFPKDMFYELPEDFDEQDCCEYYDFIDDKLVIEPDREACGFHDRFAVEPIVYVARAPPINDKYH